MALSGGQVLANQLIRYNISIKHPDLKQHYYIDVLKLALEESKDEYGDYTLQAVPVEMTQGHTSIMVELEHGLDVTWRMTSAKAEQRMLAVYIPLLKGLMGHRIFIIRADEQARFPKDISLAQLSTMIAGQGHDWPDNEILIHNNLKVVTGAGYTLLEMLEKQRYDYFPRALHEPWVEIGGKEGFIVEQNIMLQYPAPLYFFVNKKNTALRNRIYAGLSKAVENGKFDELFHQHPITKNTLALAKVKDRKIFKFHNPLLSPETKAIIDDKRLWLNNVQASQVSDN